MNVITTSHGGFMVNHSEGIAHTLEASDYKDAPMVAYGIGGGCEDMHSNENVVEGIDLYNQTSTGDVSKSLNSSATDSDHIPCVMHGGGRNSGVRYIVRRLTPLECTRLQGYPDKWVDIDTYQDSKGKIRKATDSQKYKALGNSIALPSWMWIIKRMSAQYERPATLASLFDGIGGFDWLWTQVNGRDSVLWTSEIEEFPIAVCKRHFGDEATGEGGDYENFL